MQELKQMFPCNVPEAYQVEQAKAEENFLKVNNFVPSRRKSNNISNSEFVFGSINASNYEVSRTPLNRDRIKLEGILRFHNF